MNFFVIKYQEFYEKLNKSIYIIKTKRMNEYFQMKIEKKL